ncbi:MULTISPECIES: glyoxylate/hydroxypyruvate reductase A [unclassified Martelella]|uniref:2-hydroxyacid dehydrogenase n=1 Tax=unclassified Martelella TaxID=2629616 RepID=UPI0025C3896E|nr:glyoxylate/hydroxypyruvate reductase A [Martelella sp.]
MTKSPLLIDLKFSDRAAVVAALKRHFADRDVIDLGAAENAGRDLSDCRYAILWQPDADLFSRATNLDVLFSGGAGVDKVLALEGLPDAPLVRFVDPSLTRRMSEYVVLQCLYHLRQVAAYRASQEARRWQPLPQPEACAVTVGIMGLGELGRDAAAKLKMMGFNVVGWSRTAKTIEGIETFDEADRDAFLARTDILVGLLPLTAETTGLFNLALFEKLRHGGPLGAPVFINAGRGGSQVEADIAAALDRGLLGGASLDVFETEPLSAESPLWDRENVVITPHVAADSDVGALFAHVERQIARFEAGELLEHVAERERGY